MCACALSCLPLGVMFVLMFHCVHTVDNLISLLLFAFCLFGVGDSAPGMPGVCSCTELSVSSSSCSYISCLGGRNTCELVLSVFNFIFICMCDLPVCIYICVSMCVPGA